MWILLCYWVNVFIAPSDTSSCISESAAAVEEELRDIAEQQNYNVEKLVDLVKENGIILDQMKVSEDWSMKWKCSIDTALSQSLFKLLGQPTTPHCSRCYTSRHQ